MKNKTIGYIALISWILLIVYAIVDPLIFPDKFTVIEVLESSSFTRVMFSDIGVFSTLAALWMYQSESSSRKYFFIVAVFFVGSFALLPFIGMRHLFPIQVE